MEGLHVAVVAPPWYPVPPVGYGGTELVVHLLVGELRRRGIKVSLFAAEGSAHDAIVKAPAEWTDDLGSPWQEHREVTYLGRVLEALDEMQPDLVHDHAGWASPLVFGLTSFPTLTTVHGPLYEVHTSLYESMGERTGLVAISHAQRASVPGLNWAGVVHNAVDVDALRVGTAAEKEGYLLTLARISPEKGQHVAIEIARRTGRRLVLAGKVGELPEEKEYFAKEIEPHVDGDRVVYMKNIAGREKADVLANAFALLAPLQWPEPFGLAMVEAMASGTPCLAMARGAAPELVEQGVTGLLCADTDAMVAAVDAAEEIDIARCAERARERFSPRAMVEGYLDVYSRTLGMEVTGRPVELPRVVAAATAVDEDADAVAV